MMIIPDPPTIQIGEGRWRARGKGVGPGAQIFECKKRGGGEDLLMQGMLLCVPVVGQTFFLDTLRVFDI